MHQETWFWKVTQIQKLYAMTSCASRRYQKLNYAQGSKNKFIMLFVNRGKLICSWSRVNLQITFLLASFLQQT